MLKQSSSSPTPKNYQPALLPLLFDYPRPEAPRGFLSFCLSDQPDQCGRPVAERFCIK